MSLLQTLSWDPNPIPDSPLCEVIPSLSKPTNPSMCLLTGIGSQLLSAATVAGECFRLEILECRRSLGEDVIGQTDFADSSRHCNGPDQRAEY
jgi:hypothetical protein